MMSGSIDMRRMIENAVCGLLQHSPALPRCAPSLPLRTIVVGMVIGLSGGGLSSLILPAAGIGCYQAAESDLQESEDHVLSTAEIRTAVYNAFAETHDGWSSDEVLLQDALNHEFLTACRRRLPEGQDVDFNWTLINMRKAGLLKIPTTRRASRSAADLIPLAEIAARTTYDQDQVSTDRMMCDPQIRVFFDSMAKKLQPDADLDGVRKAAFMLRKQRSLRPELVVRIADWGREITRFSTDQIRNDPQSIPQLPGIYIFQDETGYLYIGQTDNLQNRLASHFRESHNFSLAEYLKQHADDRGNTNIIVELHAFPADSRAKETMIRRAYESELIASRKPRFNIQF